MRKLFFLLLIFVSVRTVVFSQELIPDKYYLTNGVSVGVGKTGGVIKEKIFNGELQALKNSTTNFSLEYQIIGGFILNPKQLENRNLAIETGITFLYNRGEINGSSNSTLQLSQASYGIPLGLTLLTSSGKNKIKVGAGIIFLRDFLKNVSDNDSFSQTSWSLFSNGRIGLNASGTYFLKLKPKGNFMGIGLQMGHELNSNSSPDNKIPFSVRKTRFAVNVYPFLWFFKK